MIFRFPIKSIYGQREVIEQHKAHNRGKKKVPEGGLAVS